MYHLFVSNLQQPTPMSELINHTATPTLKEPGLSCGLALLHLAVWATKQTNNVYAQLRIGMSQCFIYHHVF